MWSLFKALVRVFSMRSSKKLSETEWEEYSSVQLRGKITQLFDPLFDGWASVLKSLTKVDLLENQIKSLCKAVRVPSHLPFLFTIMIVQC